MGVIMPSFEKGLVSMTLVLFHPRTSRGPVKSRKLVKEKKKVPLQYASLKGCLVLFESPLEGAVPQ